MSSVPWKRVDEIVQAALDQPADVRSGIVARRCGKDVRLRREVEDLLAACDSAADFLETPPLSSIAEAPATVEQQYLEAGTRVGRYEVRHLIGVGGMAEVYLAEQQTPVRREVALKLVKLGMDSRSIVARFRRERQTLAGLQHPGIAALYDGGLAPDGRPYLVMERIDGEHIDAYCRRRGLDLRARLRLFRDVCRTVSFAHRKLVIHRDLKPANILVVDGEDGPEPKLLDFGLARVLQEAGAPASTVTRQGPRALTPECASPEQVRGERLDTATDVYSLGVVLYQLLTGQQPYAFPSRNPHDVERTICEVSPTAPSGLNGQAAGADAPPIPPGELRGDLDTIVLKCLSKDRERRYPSAGALARDIDRVLEGAPIEARRDSAWYVLRKTLRRHRLAVSIAAAFVLVIAGGLAGTIRNAQVADRERRTAEQERDNALAVAGFLEAMLTLADPAVSRGEDWSVRDMLDLAEPMIDEHFAGRPLLEAETRHTLGATYRAVGEHDKAQAQLGAAEALFEAHAGGDDPELYRVKKSLAELQHQDAKWAHSHATAAEALEGLRRTLGPRHPETLDARRLHITTAEPIIERPSDVRLAELEDTLRIQREVLEPGDPDIAMTLRAIAEEHLANGEPARAEPVTREALRMAEEAWGPEHPRTLRVRGTLATVHGRMLRFDEKIGIRMQIYERYRAMYGDHIRTSRAMNALAWTHSNMGDYDAGRLWFQRATDMAERLYGEDMRQQTLGGVIYGLIGMGELDEAERMLREEKPSGPVHTVLSAIIALLRGECAEAERLMRSPLGKTHMLEAPTLLLGQALRCQGRFEEAEPLLLESWPQYDGRDHHLRNLQALKELALLYEEWNAAAPSEHRAREAERWRALYEQRRAKLVEAGVRIRPDLELAP